MGKRGFWEKRYTPPKIGEGDHADPNFKPRLRECGRPGCEREFETTPRWRFFCDTCRKNREVLKGLHVTYGFHGARTAKAHTT